MSSNQDLDKNIEKAKNELHGSIDQAGKAAEDAVHKTAGAAKQGIEKVGDSAKRASHAASEEFKDLSGKVKPEIERAEAYLKRPTSCSFLQGVLVGAGLVLIYAKFIARPDSSIRL
ncbi:hypothetical protein BC940DRAFT_337590 [Gongronella butleri]|nr:hypothetical protein BC940DRAFT_337590 [Gongronella butleri]